MKQGLKNKSGRKWGEIFQALGFAGMGRVEEAVIASFVTGEPLLMIGRHGSAKTAASKSLAKVLGLRFHAYDASKSVFEDVIGFPNPQSMRDGMIDYTPTPISMWDKEFVLVDELSRAQPQMQNKWLEVIRSRTLMGKELRNLKYIFAAMNPTDYIGAMPLDEALASRFAFVVEMPDVQCMSEEDVKSVIINISDDDSPGMGGAISGRPGNGDLRSKLRSELEAVIHGGLALSRKIDRIHCERIVKYLAACSRFFSDRGIYMDGRRLGMMRRSITAYLAINGFSSRDFRAAEPVIRRALAVILPFAASSQERPSKDILEMMHGMAMGVAIGRADMVYMRSQSRAAGESALKEVLADVERLDSEGQYRFVNSIIERHSKAEPKDLNRGISDILNVCLAINEQATELDRNVLEHLFDYAAYSLGLVEFNSDKFMELHEKLKSFNPNIPRECRRARGALAKAAASGDGYNVPDEAKEIMDQMTV